MTEHAELMRRAGLSRADYLRALRKEQPIEELRRKALKARTRSNLYTQEELDLANAVAIELLSDINLD